MKVLIASGGTGGHIYPGVAIANELKKRHPDWIIEFAGRKDSVEGKVIPYEGYNLNHINVSAFERYYSLWEKLKVVCELFLGCLNSFKLLRKFKPDVVLGTGGYVCGPVVLCASMKKIPTLIAEQNVVPGFTIKTLSRFANKVCLTFEDSREYMYHPDKCITTGNPIRNDFKNYSRVNARAELGMQSDDKLIVSHGGSQGARSINLGIIDLIDKFKDNDNVNFYHICGSDYYDEVIKILNDKNIDFGSKKVKVVEYSNEMPKLINAADLVVSRSGATTVCELNYTGVATIYVPYPLAANDHQTKNAKLIEKSGASIVIKDSDVNSSNFYNVVSSLIEDDERLMAMAVSAKKLGHPNATEQLCDEVERLIDNEKKKI